MKRSIVFVLLLLLFSSYASAKTVYMRNDEEIKAESAWKANGTVFVKVNRDAVLRFPANEVDLKKSGLQGGRRGKAATQNASHDLVGQVMILSGLDRSIENFTVDFLDGARAATHGDETSAGMLIAKAVADGFDIDQSEREVHKYIALHADRETLEDARRWLKSPVGEKMLAAEVAAERAGKEEVDMYVSSVQGSAEFQQHLDLLRQVERETHFSQAILRMQLMTINCLLDGLPIPAKEKEAIRKEQLAAVRRKSESFRQSYLLKLGYVYRDLTDAELKEYVAFLKTRSGKRYTDVVLGALEKMLAQTFGHFKMAKPFGEA